MSEHIEGQQTFCEFHRVFDWCNQDDAEELAPDTIALQWKSRAEKAEALNRKWNIGASKHFAGSEYVDDPKRVFARVQQLRDSQGEAMKAKVKAEAEKAQLQARVEELEGACHQRNKKRIADLEEQLKQAGGAIPLATNSRTSRGLRAVRANRH